MNEPIRILQHVRILDSGGIEAFIMANLRAIDREKVIFDFLVTRDQEEFYEKEIKELGCKKIVLKYKKFRNSFINPISQAIAFYKFCKKNKNIYKVIHFQSIGANGFLDIIAAKFAGIPYRIAHSHIANDIKPSHNSNKTTYSNFRKVFVKFRQQFIKYFVSKFSTHYFGCSKMACEWMFSKRIIKKGKAIVVKNPIDVKKFKFNSNNRNEIRKKLKVDDKFVIGHVGRFVYSKNHMFLLEVFADIKRIMPNAVLVLVGGGKLKKEIEYKIKKLNIDNDVIFYGETTEVNKVYSSFDLFLFPSIYEGLGIVLVEAQANGLPVIASNTIPKEVKLTENFVFADLNEKNKWIDIVRESNLKRNNANYEIVLKSGYDIKDVSSFLQKTYLNLYKSEG